MITCSKCGTEYDGAEVFCPKDGTRLLGGTGRHQRQSIAPGIDPLIGKTIQGRYKVLSHLGSGGMGVVYIAEHVEIEKKVALKVLRDDFSKRPEVVERFRQEARSASKIGHPHIVDVTDFGQLEDGGVYFTMEYLQGRSLSELMFEKVLPVEIAIPITIQIARALQAAHKLGIIHRDLKPENVFLVDREDQKNFVKVLDFGIAKISDRDSEGKRLTQTGMIFGTPEYMSPEQASGRELDHRVDIYSLGCIMFEMFTGQVPFGGDSFMAVLTQHMFEPMPSILEVNPKTDVPESIQNIVYKATAKDVEERYSDMTALENDLVAAFGDASYVVEQPRMDDSYRMTARPTNKGNDGPSGETKMDWSASGETNLVQGKSKKGLFLGIAVAVVAIAVGFVFFDKFMGGEPDASTSIPVIGIEDPKTTDENSTDLDTSTATDTKQGEETDTQDTDKDAAPTDEVDAVEKISVSIKSVPKGAVVFIDGLGQVCSSTPCELELDVGSPVEFQAKLGRKKAKMTFTPSSQNKELTLELKGGGGSGRPPGQNSGNNSNNSNSTQNNTTELKIPGIFKDD